MDTEVVGDTDRGLLERPREHVCGICTETRCRHIGLQHNGLLRSSGAGIVGGNKEIHRTSGVVQRHGREERKRRWYHYRRRRYEVLLYHRRILEADYSTDDSETRSESGYRRKHRSDLRTAGARTYECGKLPERVEVQSFDGAEEYDGCNSTLHTVDIRRLGTVQSG